MRHNQSDYKKICIFKMISSWRNSKLINFIQDYMTYNKKESGDKTFQAKGNS